MATVPLNRAVQQQHLNTKPGACQFADATGLQYRFPGRLPEHSTTSGRATHNRKAGCRRRRDV